MLAMTRVAGLLYSNLAMVTLTVSNPRFDILVAIKTLFSGHATERYMAAITLIIVEKMSMWL